GGRAPALPTDMRADLELLDEHRFSNGVVQLRYRLCDAGENRTVKHAP
ncbi:MAG: hypothetical protein QOJ69_2191, partial [Actinomycetota bacterium]|nr:hypothetical protein [Actinomycetota bacterium]